MWDPHSLAPRARPEPRLLSHCGVLEVGGSTDSPPGAGLLVLSLQVSGQTAQPPRRFCSVGLVGAEGLQGLR